MADPVNTNFTLQYAVEEPIGHNYDVNIKKVSNGFIIIIGCKTFVSKTWKEASEALDLYYSDPKAAREKYCEDEKTTEKGK